MLYMNQLVLHCLDYLDRSRVIQSLYWAQIVPNIAPQNMLNFIDLEVVSLKDFFRLQLLIQKSNRSIRNITLLSMLRIWKSVIK